MKKIIALLSTLIISIAMLTACSSQDDTTAEEETQEPQYTVGIAMFGDHPSLENCKDGFLQGLEEEGIVEGENLEVDLQSAQFDTNTANQIAQSMVAQDVDMICAIATPMAQSAFNAAESTDIPTVFTAVSDPETAMLTEGNVTGTADKLPVEAQLQMIRAMLPEATTIGILYCTSEANSLSTLETYKELAPQYDFEIVESGVSTSADIPLAADNLLLQVDCLSNLTDNTVVGSLQTILDKANKLNIPVFGSEVEQVKDGCVASEGINYIDLGVQTGKMAAQILKGEAQASDMPYETIEASELYVNYEAMEALGIEMPEELADRALDANEE